jgi:hypothetical protein
MSILPSLRRFFLFASILGFASAVYAAEAIPAEKLWLDVPEELQKECSPALADFQRCFTLLTGQPLPTSATAKATVPLRLKSLPLEAADETFMGRGRAGDYSIDASADEVVLSGKTPLALSNALYGLLDKWGFRWAFPGELGEIVPKDRPVALPFVSEHVHIASDPRLLGGPPSYYSEGEVGDWVRRSRFAKESLVTAHHSWASLIVPSFVYNDPSKPDTYHPEYFSLIAGKRLEGTDSTRLQICTSNPEVIRLGIERAKKYLRDNPGADTFPCSPEDNFEFCQCDNCLALDTGKLTPEGIPDVSDRVMTFVNEIARGIRDEFPNKLVGVYAYNNYTRPPTKVKPESNVMLDITRMNYDLLRLMPRDAGDSSAKFVELVESWKALTPYIYLYEYNPIYWSAGLPCPNYLEYAEAQRYFRDKGVLGFRSDPGELPFRNKVNFLNDYLSMRIAVDDKADLKKELEEVCAGLFGPAGASMAKYYEILSHVTDRNPVPEGFLGGGVRHFHRMFNPEMLKQASEALAQAKSEIGDDPVLRKRLRMVEMSQRYLASYLDAIWLAKAGDYAGSVKAVKLMERALESLAAGKVMDSAARWPMLHGGVMMAQAEYTPKEAGFVQDWKVLGPFDNSDRSGELKLADFEPVTDMKTGVKTASGETLRWISHRAPTGYLNLSEVFKNKPKEWSAFTAYAGVELRVKEPTRVWLSYNSFNSFRVYLNGKEIFFRPGQQLDLPGQYGIGVELQAGENQLVFRCTEAASGPTFPFGIYLRVLDPENPAQPKQLVSKTDENKG